MKKLPSYKDINSQDELDDFAEKFLNRFLSQLHPDFTLQDIKLPVSASYNSAAKTIVVQMEGSPTKEKLKKEITKLEQELVEAGIYKTNPDADATVPLV